MGAIPTELQLLLAAVAIGLAQLVLATVVGAAAGRDLGWMLGPRDTPRPVTGLAGRLERAFANFCETFPLFAAALLAAVAAGRTGSLTHTGALLYIGGRALYPFLYVAGVPVLRTLAWALAVAGIVMIAVGVVG
ncbi:MAG TPA: MAPEG family protein [Phenylobacterium sp.]|jgi:uncharacterized MAPEG superfamily protein